MSDILTRPPPAADVRIPYGPHASQFGELYLPKSPGPHPVVVAVHGGFWRAQYDLRHLSHLCAALAREGFAVWSLEYRRLGEVGGGWPGTFEDVAAGAAFLQTLAAKYALDVKRTVTLGHSAGGHLALWLAARRRLPSANPFHATPILHAKGVVALAAVSDLALGEQWQLSAGVVRDLLAGTPAEVPDRYAIASPAQLIPFGVTSELVHGRLDQMVPFDMSVRYVERARKAHDPATLVAIDAVGHFELIDPESAAWPVVLQAVRKAG